MSQPFVGQIIRVGFEFAPEGWMRCEGQLLPISQNETLYNLIGTTFGGDGNKTFALPDLKGRVPIGSSQDYPFAQQGGSERVTLTPAQMPSHQHSANVYPYVGDTGRPHSENALANEGPGAIGTLVYTYAPYDAANMVALHDGSVSYNDGQSHENRQPFQVVLYAISLFGIFPSQN